VQDGTRRLVRVLLAVPLAGAFVAACGSVPRDGASSDSASPPSEAGVKTVSDAAASHTTAPVPNRAGTWTGDFDALLDRRMIRMLVPYSPTLFYHDRGQARVPSPS